MHTQNRIRHQVCLALYGVVLFYWCLVAPEILDIRSETSIIPTALSLTITSTLTCLWLMFGEGYRSIRFWGSIVFLLVCHGPVFVRITGFQRPYSGQAINGFAAISVIAFLSMVFWQKWTGWRLVPVAADDDVHTDDGRLVRDARRIRVAVLLGVAVAMLAVASIQMIDRDWYFVALGFSLVAMPMSMAYAAIVWCCLNRRSWAPGLLVLWICLPICGLRLQYPQVQLTPNDLETRLMWDATVSALISVFALAFPLLVCRAFGYRLDGYQPDEFRKSTGKDVDSTEPEPHPLD